MSDLERARETRLKKWKLLKFWIGFFWGSIYRIMYTNVVNPIPTPISVRAFLPRMGALNQNRNGISFLFLPLSKFLLRVPSKLPLCLSSAKALQFSFFSAKPSSSKMPSWISLTGSWFRRTLYRADDRSSLRAIQSPSWANWLKGRLPNLPPKAIII